MATDVLSRPLRRGERVRASIDLPGIPEGTPGKVRLVEGLTWIRYWVSFDNGVWRGSLDRRFLVPESDWETYRAARDAGEIPAPRLFLAVGEEEEQAAAETATEAGDTGGGAASRIPAHLLERSRKARERAAAKKAG